MMKNNLEIQEYNFRANTKVGLFICAGGFEERTLAFLNRTDVNKIEIEMGLLIQYESQKEDNADNFNKLKQKLKDLSITTDTVSVHADTSVLSSGKIREKIEHVCDKISQKSAIVDISGMTHLWAISIIHACVSCCMEVTVVYTEARSYFPLKKDVSKLLRAWKNQDYEICSHYLQSSGLKHINILPEFGGNFRPEKQTCLLVFVGYEPNRIVDLVDDYAPGRLIVLYGKSPRKDLQWRTDLSKDLHKELFDRWFVRETEISTLQVRETITKLEDEFAVVQEEYDVAIASQCSKMQAIASYLFWRKHPEVQLVFTTPVRFNPARYSKGAQRTYFVEIT